MVKVQLLNIVSIYIFDKLALLVNIISIRLSSIIDSVIIILSNLKFLVFIIINDCLPKLPIKSLLIIYKFKI